MVIGSGNTHKGFPFEKAGLALTLVKTGEPGGTRDTSISSRLHWTYWQDSIAWFFSVPFNNFVLILDMLFYHI